MVVLINIIVILMISSKLAAVGVLEIKLFRNKNYDVIISVHDVTKKILLSDPIYIEDIAVLWPIFGNSSISLREVIITSILSVFDKQNKFFWGVLLVQVQWFGTSTRKGLEILHQPKLTIKFGCNDKCLICRTCSKQYTGETTGRFRYRWNNYKMEVRKAENGDMENVKQIFLQSHFLQDDHKGFLDDFEVRLIRHNVLTTLSENITGWEQLKLSTQMV